MMRLHFKNVVIIALIILGIVLFQDRPDVHAQPRPVSFPAARSSLMMVRMSVFFVGWLVGCRLGLFLSKNPDNIRGGL